MKHPDEHFQRDNHKSPYKIERRWSIVGPEW